MIADDVRAPAFACDSKCLKRERLLCLWWRQQALSPITTNVLAETQRGLVAIYWFDLGVAGSLARSPQDSRFTSTAIAFRSASSGYQPATPADRSSRRGASSLPHR